MARTSFHLLGKTAAELLGRESPAESGKAFGFDRPPCIETFREKIEALAKDLSRVKGRRDAPAKLWISQMPEELGRAIGADKRFKVCTARKGRIAGNRPNDRKRRLPSLPRLRANALGGEPLFCICKKPAAGLCRRIEEDVVPKSGNSAFSSRTRRISAGRGSGRGRPSRPPGRSRTVRNVRPRRRRSAKRSGPGPP